jgi:hypothetical protein
MKSTTTEDLCRERTSLRMQRDAFSAGHEPASVMNRLREIERELARRRTA